ncbi:MAG: hypothetical protein JNL51_15705 [Chitinophagaceae bacterium]|nr:hypothetical protein [Chitinophagaceae bacterium]
MAFNAQSQFKLVEIGDSTARIKMNASLESIPGTPDQLLAAGSAKLKGSQDGELAINTVTGMISSAKVKGKISGKVMVLYNEVPLTITTERHTTTRIL